MPAEKRPKPRARRAPRLAEVGAIYTHRVGNKFGACQVLALRHEGSNVYAEVATLDWLESKAPSIAEAAKLKVIRKNFGNWNGIPDRLCVDQRVPWNFEMLGVAKPVEVFSRECEYFGGWGSVPNDSRESAAIAARWIALSGPGILPPPAGSEKCIGATYSGLVDTDTSALASFESLKVLTLRGAPGKIRDASGVAAIAPSLRELVIRDVYDLDAAGWPRDWPMLDGVTIHNIRKIDALILKSTFDEVPDVRITGAHDDAWISANLENPFREWGEDEPALGRGAIAAWKKAKTAATKLGPNAKANDAEAVLEELVVTLNKLGKKYDIDTIRREEAGDAFAALAKSMGQDGDVSETSTESLFDRWRDF